MRSALLQDRADFFCSWFIRMRNWFIAAKPIGIPVVFLDRNHKNMYLKSDPMKISFFTLLIALLILTACSKDDEPENAVTSSNKYSYAGTTYEIIDAEYAYIDGDTYLYFRGAGNASYVQLVFAKITGNIPTGTFTYNYERNSQSYDPDSNFWTGVVTTEANSFGHNLNSGTITILNKDGAHEVTFTVGTNEGTAEGTYTGKIRPR